MRNYKTRAIILSRRNFSESDKVLTILTSDHGKISVIAKGIRRINSRRAPHLELFNEIELMLYKPNHAGLETVTETKIVNTFPQMRSKLKLIGYAFYVGEILEKIIPENVPHEKVYGSLKELLTNLGSYEKPENKIKEFVIQLTWELGFLPFGQYPKEGVTNFIESIVEKRINSKKFLEQI